MLESMLGGGMGAFKIDQSISTVTSAFSKIRWPWVLKKFESSFNAVFALCCSLYICCSVELLSLIVLLEQSIVLLVCLCLFYVYLLFFFIKIAMSIKNVSKLIADMNVVFALCCSMYLCLLYLCWISFSNEFQEYWRSFEAHCWNGCWFHCML